MYKITVTDIETGTIEQEATGECIIAAASTSLPEGEEKTSIIKVYTATPLTVAHTFSVLMREFKTICADDTDIAAAYLYVESLSKPREAQEEVKEDE